jgi:hypothetical protein
MGSKIRVNKQNVDALAGALEALRTHLRKLAALTKDYPVECSFAGYRFVFTSEGDIVELIETIDEKLTAFRSAA